MEDKPDVVETHRRSSNHREAILRAERCGCFYCCVEFEPAEIREWIDPVSEDTQAGKTALCPRCGIDSVIPLERGMDIDFLQRMKEHWF